MKLKNKLMISYAIVILGIILLAFFIIGKGMERLIEENTQIARVGVENIVKGNNELSSQILTNTGEKLVKMRSEIVANKLKWLLINYKKPYDYKTLRNNKKIRKIATQAIYVPGDKDKIPAGHIDIIDIHGSAVIHPNKLLEGQNYRKWEKQYPEMWKLVEASFSQPTVSGYYTFIDTNNQPVKKFMVLTRIKDTPFIVVAWVKINCYFVRIQQKAREKGEKHKQFVDTEMEKASNVILYDFQIKGIIGVLALIIFGILLSIWQAGTIAKPVQSLCQKVKELGKGDFSITTPEKGSSEVAELAAAFNALGGELTEYIENLKRETTARQAIESEIAITRKIQETLLPHTFPPFPDRKEFDLYATLVPAKDVSGDFYDFFFVDDETLILIIADVSGKGLPASLFMAVTRTLLRNLCMNTKDFSPSAIFNKANDYLCQDNDACMFVTTFLAFYNIKSGKLTYANAGHNEMISRQEKTGFRHFGSFPDLPLGIISDYSYQQAEYTIETDETLVFYTDGATEAVDKNNEQYGMERFIAKIEEYNLQSPLNPQLHSWRAFLGVFENRQPQNPGKSSEKRGDDKF